MLNSHWNTFHPLGQSLDLREQRRALFHSVSQAGCTVSKPEQAAAASKHRLLHKVQCHYHHNPHYWRKSSCGGVQATVSWCNNSRLMVDICCPYHKPSTKHNFLWFWCILMFTNMLFINVLAITSLLGRSLVRFPPPTEKHNMSSWINTTVQTHDGRRLSKYLKFQACLASNCRLDDNHIIPSPKTRPLNLTA